MNAQATWAAQLCSLVACAGFAAAAALAASRGDIFLAVSGLVVGICATVVHTAIIFDS